MATMAKPITQTAAATVIINVLNENNKSPVVMSVSVNVSEQHVVGSEVYRVKASDPDKDKLVFSISSGSDDKFVISDDGTINLASSLNYDIRKLYRLSISVTDDKFTATGIVNINVIAAVKPPPIFSKAVYVLNIPETTQVGTSIIALTVTNDSPPTIFKINEQLGNDFFTIDGNGIVRTSRQFNFEARRQHIFTVTVTDRRSSGSTAIIVNLIDVDDTCPTLTPLFQTVQVSDPVMVGTIVAVVQARDQDTNNISFSLTGGNGIFKIDHNGGIRASKNLNIDNAIDYVLKVKASDGVCIKEASVTVTVNPLAPCSDCNKFSFTKTLYQASVHEGVIPKSALLSVGSGFSSTSSMNYTISDKTTLEYVKINSTTGK